MEDDWENEIGSNAAPVVQLPPPAGGSSFSGFAKSNDINNNVDDSNKPAEGGDRFAKSFGGFAKTNFGGGGDNGGERRVNFSDRNNGGGGGGGFKPRFNNQDGERNGGAGGGFRGPRREGGFGGDGGDRQGAGGFNRERKPWGDRQGGGGGGFGGFRRNQDGENGGADGEDKPKSSFGGFGGGGGGGYGGSKFNRDGQDGGERKPFGGFNRDRPPRDGQDGGERKPFGGFNRDRPPRDGQEGGERKPFGGFNRDRPPRDGQDGGERKPFGGFNRDRSGGADGERKPFGGFGGGRGGREPAEGDMDRKENRERYIPTYDDDENEDKLFHSMSVGINFKKQAEIPVNLSGEGDKNIRPIERFDEAKLSDLLLSNVKKSGYEIPTPVQKYAIPIVLERRDLMACAQTGSGKTAAFVLPIMTNILHDGIESSGLMTVQRPQALILSPTRELAVQIFHECKKFSHGSIIKTAILYGGVDTGFQLRNLEKGCNILVATPGRLLDVLEKGKISLEKVKYFVLDEADRMLDMGFEKSVREILEKGKVDTSKDRCTLMFSATFPKEIQKLAQDFLHNYLFLAIGIVGGANTDVEQRILKVGRFEKRDEIIKIIDEIGNERIMIFMEHKKQADILAFYLLQKKYPCTSIHGDRLQSQRETALAEFKSGKSKIIVCTSVAARGLDIEKVSYVINYDLPQTIDEYVHRIGRTGRCGNLGKAISFFDPNSESDRRLARSLVITLRQANQEIPEWLTATAEDSYGTSFARDAGTDDLREQFNKFSVSDAAKPASSAAPEQVEENWD